MSLRNTTLVLAPQRSVHEDVTAVYAALKKELSVTIKTLLGSDLYDAHNKWLSAVEKILPDALRRQVDNATYFSMQYTSMACLLAAAAIERNADSAELWSGEDSQRITLPVAAAGIMPDLLNLPQIPDNLRIEFRKQILPLAAPKMQDVIGDVNLLERLYKVRLLSTRALPNDDIDEVVSCHKQWCVLMKLAAKKPASKVDIAHIEPNIQAALSRLGVSSSSRPLMSEYLQLEAAEDIMEPDQAMITTFRSEIFTVLQGLV